METQVKKKRKKKAIVIGLVGKAGSGKDTVFSLFQAMVPDKEFVRLAFGDEVKKEVSDHHAIPVEVIEENKDVFRGLLQKWGTDFRRKKNEKYWIDKVRTEISFLRDNVDVVIITDVRFLNEVDYIKNECKGFIIRINGSEQRMLESTHRSEIELDTITPDWLLPNKKGMQELVDGISFLIQELDLIEDTDGQG